MSDLTINEFIHFLELTGDYSALEFIAKEFDFTLIKNDEVFPTCHEINILVDNLQLEGNEVFKVAKEALVDKKIDKFEKVDILKEIDEVVKAALELKKELKAL